MPGFPSTTSVLVVAIACTKAPLVMAAEAGPVVAAVEPSWGLAASGGGVGGLGIASDRSNVGVEASLWLGKMAPTRAIGLDAGWNTKGAYAELQVAKGLWYGHDGELEIGLGAGPLYDRARGGRWGEQVTTWIAVAPAFIFPYLRVEALGAKQAAMSAGLMIKFLGPFYRHR